MNALDLSNTTPGPWRVENPDALEPFIMAGDQFVATCHDVKWSHQTEHNAHLIAATLDLLAALKRVGCQDAGSCGAGQPDGRCFVCAAIAKSRGDR